MKELLKIIYKNLIWLIIICALLIVADAFVKSASASRGKVFLIGIDGVDPQVVDFLAARGELPNTAGEPRAIIRLSTDK